LLAGYGQVPSIWAQARAEAYGDALSLTAKVSVPSPPEPVEVTPAGTTGNIQGGPVSRPALARPAPDTADQNGVSLTARSGFKPPHPKVGDTLEYAIEVTWRDTRIPVLVMAPDSVAFNGVKMVGQSTRHQKSAHDGTVENRTVFSFTLLADQPGMAKAGALKVRYTTGLSGREEAVFAPGAQVEILPARFAFLRSPWFQGLLVLLLLAAAGLGGVAWWRRQAAESARKKAREEASGQGLPAEVMALKSRIGHGESREIILEMEKLGLRHLALTFSADPSQARFEPLLDKWLEVHADEYDRVADWERLRDLFRQARYAGGHKEPHELQDGWRALRRCLNLADEP